MKDVERKAGPRGNDVTPSHLNHCWGEAGGQRGGEFYDKMPKNTHWTGHLSLICIVIKWPATPGYSGKGFPVSGSKYLLWPTSLLRPGPANAQLLKITHK